ncbi:unnamed protein product [Somion occarium]|uniref:Uncharacterized protein n=1 Tax=Somion occarium TaxID=3059160 RepID=A0ABP1E6B6_9APHY
MQNPSVERTLVVLSGHTTELHRVGSQLSSTLCAYVPIGPYSSPCDTAILELRKTLDGAIHDFRKIAFDCSAAANHLRSNIFPSIQGAQINVAITELNRYQVSLQRRSRDCQQMLQQFKSFCGPSLATLESRIRENSSLSSNEDAVSRHRPEVRNGHHARQWIHNVIHRSSSRSRVGRQRGQRSQTSLLESIIDDCQALMGGLRIFPDFYVQLSTEVTKVYTLLCQNQLQDEDLSLLDQWLTGMSAIFDDYRSLRS